MGQLILRFYHTHTRIFAKAVAQLLATTYLHHFTRCSRSLAVSAGNELQPEGCSPAILQVRKEWALHDDSGTPKAKLVGRNSLIPPGLRERDGSR